MIRYSLSTAGLALAGALAVVGVAGATSPASKQRIAINVTIRPGAAPNGTFELTPLNPGLIARDSGSITSVDPVETHGVRDGQAFTRFPRTTTTFTGKNGTLVIREDQYVVSASRGISVDTATWIVIRGTGAYKRVRGKGRQASVLSEAATTPYPIRYEGMLTSP